MTRQEHLAWAKERALKENSGYLMWASMVSDLSKHEELKNHIGIELGNKTINLNDTLSVKKFIEGFN